MRFSYLNATRAMQAGVVLDEATGASNLTPKHLRVGVNSALCDGSAVARLLIAKGVISQDEYLEAITAVMNEEVERYEQDLTAKLGRKVTLSPGDAHVEGASLS